MFAVMPVNAGHKFVDRGDVDSVDFDENVLTQDNTWQVLNLTTVIPKSTKLVLIHGICRHATALTGIEFKTNGNVYPYNGSELRSMVTNQKTFNDILIVPDSDGKIQYRIGDSGWSKIDLTIGGWWV